MIQLEEARAILDRQLDDGAKNASLMCFEMISSREIKGDKTRSINAIIDFDEVWFMRTQCENGWSVVCEPTHDRIKDRMVHSHLLLKNLDASKTKHMIHGNEAMAGKPVRQFFLLDKKGQEQPALEDVYILLDQVFSVFGNQVEGTIRDDKIRFTFWDTEGSYGVREYSKASLNVIAGNPQTSLKESYQCYHFQEGHQAIDFKNLSWLSELKKWKHLMSQSDISSEQLSELPWFFSPRAFGKLILKTLGPALCLERPDPFYSEMNPASLEGVQIASECLNMYSNPKILSESDLFDHEGVPAKKIQLIEKGVLKNFILSRTSAIQLRRSLSVRNEKALTGSSYMNHSSGSISPIMQHIEVEEGESLADSLDKSYVIFHDINVDSLNAHQDKFVISSTHCLVSKHGGLHRRRVRELKFYVSRKQLWHQLLRVGEQQELVVMSHGYSKNKFQPYVTMSLPMAEFRGFECH